MSDSHNEPRDETERLLRQAAEGDRSAIDRLLTAQRPRLRQMVAVRMSDELKARIDPSDVVQETLAEAAGRIQEYESSPEAPFYLWLRKIAAQRLIDATRKHVMAQVRSVRRERSFSAPVSGHSAQRLAERLVTSGKTPSKNARQQETREQVQFALASLAPEDRDLLIMRYLEQLQPNEIAELLGISDRTVRARHRRALQRMLRLLRSRDFPPPDSDGP